MFSKFKQFAMKGNFFDMAVGIVIGAAFSTIVGSLDKRHDHANSRCYHWRRRLFEFISG